MLVMVVVLAMAAYAALSWERSRAIETVCASAQADFDGSRVEVLIALVTSESTDLREKNRAIWVLGELRDERALPVLRALEGSETCDHARYVCQYEIRKAIKKIEGETINPFFWQRSRA
jgi:HEAT repeat protein